MPPSPPSRSNRFLWIFAAAAVVFWVTWTALDVRIVSRDDAAHASGLFGSAETEGEASTDDAGTNFWRENADAEPIVPRLALGQARIARTRAVRLLLRLYGARKRNLCKAMSHLLALLFLSRMRTIGD